MDFKNRELFKVYMGHRRLAWLCYLLSARAFVPISWNRVKNEEKKHIFYQRFHLILIVIAYIPYKFTANFFGSLVLADQITQCALSLVKSIY